MCVHPKAGENPFVSQRCNSSGAAQCPYSAVSLISPNESVHLALHSNGEGHGLPKPAWLTRPVTMCVRSPISMAFVLRVFLEARDGRVPPTILQAFYHVSWISLTPAAPGEHTGAPNPRYPAAQNVQRTPQQHHMSCHEVARPAMRACTMCRGHIAFLDRNPRLRMFVQRVTSRNAMRRED